MLKRFIIAYLITGFCRGLINVIMINSILTNPNKNLIDKEFTEEFYTELSKTSLSLHQYYLLHIIEDTLLFPYMIWIEREE